MQRVDTFTNNNILIRRGQEKELVVRKAKFVEDQAGKLNLSNNVKQHMDSLDVVLDKLEKLSQEMPQGEDLKVVQTTMNNVSELVKVGRNKNSNLLHHY